MTDELSGICAELSSLWVAYVPDRTRNVSHSGACRALFAEKQASSERTEERVSQKDVKNEGCSGDVYENK